MTLTTRSARQGRGQGCKDDPTGGLAAVNLNCKQMVPAVGCNADLRQLIPDALLANMMGCVF